MNFLELCQRTYRETGEGGTPPQSVSDQYGNIGRIVDWVRDAWREIQTGQQWEFLRKRAQFNTVAGQQSYPMASIASDVRKFDKTFGRITTDGKSSPLRWIEHYTIWRDQFEASGATPARPQYVVHGNGVVAFDTAPDAAYPVTLEYWSQPQMLSTDTDIPLVIDESDQLAIVWLAVMKYAALEAASELYQPAANNYAAVLLRMQHTYLPQPIFAVEPIA